MEERLHVNPINFNKGVLLNDQEAEMLIINISNEEINMGLKDIENEKVSGLDGFNAFLLQKCLRANQPKRVHDCE